MKKIYSYYPIPVNKILPKGIIVSLLLAIFLTSLLINPEKTKLFACQFNQLTGCSCPTCGLTRSFHAFSHMNFQESFRFHLMGPIIYVVLLFVFVKFSIEIVTGREIKLKIDIKIGKKAIIFLFGSFLWFWIIRLMYEIQH